MRFNALLFHCLASLLILSMSGCSVPTETDITFLYLTDLHGLLLPDDFIDGGVAKSSLANFSTYKNIVTQDDPERFILLCGGDVNVDQPSIYFYNNYVKYEDHISASVLNYLGFDAVQIGSNDLYCGSNVNQKLLPAQYKMPFLCANAVNDVTGECAMDPYAIIERNGVRIAVLGMMDPRIRFTVRASYYKGMHFEPIKDCARYWVKKIRETENPDLIIGMFHSDVDGLRTDVIPDVDLFLVGFDHRNLPVGECVVNEKGDSISIVEPLHHCQEVARVDIHMKRVDGRWTRDSVSVQRINLTGYPRDEKFCETFKQASNQVDTYLSSHISQYDHNISASDAVFGPSVIADMIHNMQLWVTKADVSLSNVTCSMEGIKAGPFTMRDIFKLYRFDNQVLVENMSGAEIKSYLEHAADVQFNTMQSSNDHLLAFKYNELGEVHMGQYGPELLTPIYTYSSAAGIRYVVDVSKPNGQKVTILSMSDGSPFELGKVYRVAMTDYQAAGGGYHISEGCGWNLDVAEERCIFHGDMDLRMYLVNYIKLHPNQPVCRNDWEVIPRDWWEKGKQRDYKMLKRTFEGE